MRRRTVPTLLLCGVLLWALPAGCARPEAEAPSPSAAEETESPVEDGIFYGTYDPSLKAWDRNARGGTLTLALVEYDPEEDRVLALPRENLTLEVGDNPALSVEGEPRAGGLSDFLGWPDSLALEGVGPFYLLAATVEGAEISALEWVLTEPLTDPDQVPYQPGLAEGERIYYGKADLAGPEWDLEMWDAVETATLEVFDYDPDIDRILATHRGQITLPLAEEVTLGRIYSRRTRSFDGARASYGSFMLGDTLSSTFPDGWEILEVTVRDGQVTALTWFNTGVDARSDRLTPSASSAEAGAAIRSQRILDGVPYTGLEWAGNAASAEDLSWVGYRDWLTDPAEITTEMIATGLLGYTASGREGEVMPARARGGVEHLTGVAYPARLRVTQAGPAELELTLEGEGLRLFLTDRDSGQVIPLEEGRHTYDLPWGELLVAAAGVDASGTWTLTRLSGEVRMMGLAEWAWA